MNLSGWFVLSRLRSKHGTSTGQGQSPAVHNKLYARFFLLGRGQIRSISANRMHRAIRLGSLSTGEAVALIPYADLFNHNPFANSYIDARQTGFFEKTDEVAVFADRSYKNMEQVGCIPNPRESFWLPRVEAVAWLESVKSRRWEAMALLWMKVSRSEGTGATLALRIKRS